jgi:uncharacterized protein YebE (UPF0316 family)
MTFLITFVVLSIINVVFSTIRSITTIKSGKTVASLISGGYFAFYNIMLVYTVSDFPMWEKCLITFICNVIGVYVVKLVEEKTTKDKLWKVELTVRVERTNVLARQLEELEIPYNYIPNVGKWTVFNVYCATQKESAFVKEIAIRNKAKFFASEAKQL